MPQFLDRGYLKLRSVVLIQEHNVSLQLNWVLGRVEELYPGRDGKVRSVKVKTSKGELVRAIQRLHKLEVLDSVHDLSIAQTDQPSIQTDQHKLPVNMTNLCFWEI